ncbi:MAG: DUF2270 domain-containing protein [Chloroflexi bacterium]|nr:DUF2270 domain-containing protein [Chloroflexota bacterium]
MSEEPPPTPNEERPSFGEEVWTFRGYQMRSGEFNTAMVHFYRAEVQRANVWRNRLDTTTNWAVVAAGAAISFTLSDPGNNFGVIILNTLLVTLFLWIEARRYRYYELWSLRTRLMETDFFAAMLIPPFAPHPEWDEALAESLLQPQFPITVWEAFGRRFRRNYLWIYLILAGSWALKTFLHPTPAATWAEFVSRSALGTIPGEIVLLIGLLFNGIIFAVGFLSLSLTEASGEVLPKYPRFPNFWSPKKGAPASADTLRSNWIDALRPARQRQQLLVLVVAQNPQAIADRVQKEMNRGVTALHGRGMYHKQDRDVLLIAASVLEIAGLKAIVRQEDPDAFVIVTPAKEILGGGFQRFTDD